MSSSPGAQDQTADKAIKQYLKAQAAELEKDFLPQVKTAADFERLRPELRRQYFDMLGLWPIPEKTPLNAKVTGRIEGEGFTIENLHYQSKPGLYVTANLYLPKPIQGRHPAILYACGHSGKGRDGNKTSFQDHGIWFATHGYVCLVTDTLQLGEIAATHHGTYRFSRWWWWSAGYTPAGVECWNGVRGVDYLISRPEVDPDRIGATGISGGGAATFWLAAADERVKVAVPVSGMADLGFYVAEDGVNGHCDCMFLHNIYRWNWTTIAALVCPRPMLFTNSDKDGIFPMSANERVINRLKILYARFGLADKVDAMVSIGGHAYRTDLRRAIFEFFNRHLKQDFRPVTDPDMGLTADGKQKYPGKELRAFPEDNDIPADQLNTKIDETFVPVAKVESPPADNFDVWRKDRLEQLRKTSFSALSPLSWLILRDPPGGLLYFREETGNETTEQGLDIAWKWIATKAADAPAWLIVLSPDETMEVPEWARSLAGEGPVLLVAPRRGWTRKNPPNTVERSMALIGTTADTGRAWDVMKVATHRGHWRVAGRGQAGILAAYAALYLPALQSVTLVDPPSSHREGPHFLGVLKVWDIPDALGALAPRPLTIIGGKKEAFDRTAELYRLAGAADKLERK